MKRRNRPLDAITADVRVTLVRNAQKRLRVGKVDVALHPTIEGGVEALAPCLDSFEDFCVVTQSVREGIEVNVTVEPTA